MTDAPIPAPVPDLDAKPTVKVRHLLYDIDESRQGFYWPSSEQKRQEINSVRRNDPSAFESTYQGRPGQREGTIFLSDDLNAFYRPPQSLCLARNSPEVVAFLSRGHMVLQAWDTAFSTTLQSAHSVCVTAMLIPCQSYHRGEDATLLGPCDSHFDVFILDVLRKRLDWGALTSALKSQFHLWRPDEIVIEKKASGISLIQAMESSGFPIIPAKAGESKGARAVNSVTLKTAGSVQGWFRQHRVLTPNSADLAPWLIPWRTEMKDFSGNDDASSDQVDATVHLVTRAIQLGAGGAVLPSDWTPERSALPSGIVDPFTPDNSVPDPRTELLGFIGALPSLQEDPFHGTCARCAHNTRRSEAGGMSGNAFCEVHHRTMLSLDSCVQYDDMHDAAALSALDTETANVGRI